MDHPRPLAPDQILVALLGSPWEIETDGLAIHRALRFESFPAALGFMVQVGVACEVMDHHPEWSNVHDRLTVRLTTHDAGGVTDKDLALARHMDRVFAGRIEAVR